MSTANLPAATGGALVASLATEGASMTVAQIKANRELMKQVMADLMEQGVHYGKVPGSDKPGLFKPGAELLCVVFRVNARPRVEDLSTADCIRYRVTMTGIHIPTGAEIASGIGECSTDEEKYKWRAAKCREEFEETHEDRRRWKWKGSGEDNGVNQVRTNPADAANTVLKMAEKRAKVDLALSFTGASDVFSQDLEDTAEWLREPAEGGDQPMPAHSKSGSRPPQRKAGSSSAPASDAKVNEAQLSVLSSQLDHAGIPERDFLAQFGIDKPEDLPFARLNEAIQWARSKNTPPAEKAK